MHFTKNINDVDADDAMAHFDAAFGLMTLELSRLFPGLLNAFGGEDQSAIIDGEPVVLADPRHLPQVHQEDSADNSLAAAAKPDNLYKEVELFVVEEQSVSISRVQRKFQIGYNRAAHLVEELSEGGVVSSVERDGGRRVLMSNVARLKA